MGLRKKSKSKNAQVVICPPFVYLPLLKGLPLGAQNIFWEREGGFYGRSLGNPIKRLKN